MTTVDLRTGEIIDHALALRATDAGAIEAADPKAAAEMVIAALQESRSWLAVAMRGTDPTPIAEFKAWAATIEVATHQKNLGREIELDAAEMVRRAERGIGVAIRNGQEAGEIATRAEDRSRAGRISRARQLGNNELPKEKPSPSDIVPAHELSDNGAGIYHLTDGVTDEDFETAIAEAKAEGNLSRANVVRKAKGEPAKPSTDRPEHLRKTRHHNANRIVEELVITLDGCVMSLDLIDWEQLDPTKVNGWSDSLNESLRSLNRLNRQLKELNQP